eukprot:1137637-Pelagomonas_calceolata.AAC.3
MNEYEAVFPCIELLFKESSRMDCCPHALFMRSLLKDFDTRFAASSTPSRSGAVRGVPVTDFSVERANDVD